MKKDQKMVSKQTMMQPIAQAVVEATKKAILAAGETESTGEHIITTQPMPNNKCPNIKTTNI